MQKKRYTVLLTSAIVIDGSIRKAGTELELEESVAKDLLRRERAKLPEHPVDVKDEGEIDSQADSDPADDVDLNKLTKPELLEVAAGLKIVGVDSLTKAELIKVITEATGA